MKISSLLTQAEASLEIAPSRFDKLSDKQKKSIMRNWALRKIAFHRLHIRGVLLTAEQRKSFDLIIDELVQQIKDSR